jgi:hypothetical protein
MLPRRRTEISIHVSHNVTQGAKTSGGHACAHRKKAGTRKLSDLMLFAFDPSAQKVSRVNEKEPK